MTDKQENRLAMFETVKTFIASNVTTLNSLPHFADFRAEFEDVISQIKSTRMRQETRITGISIGKTEAKETLISEAYILSRKIVAFAMLSANETLKAEVDHPKSKLQNATDLILIDLCAIIRDRANTFMAELEPYNVTAAMIANLGARITAFTDVMLKPKAAMHERKLNTDRIKALFEAGDSILKNKLDLLIGIIPMENRTIHYAYKSARKVSKIYGTRRLAVIVKVTDKNGNPLKNVEVKITGSKISKKTTDKGAFQIASMPGGVYSFRFVRDGYQPANAMVAVNKGETSKVKIVMESVPESVEA